MIIHVFDVSLWMCGGVAIRLEDYLQYGLNQLNLVHTDIRSIGWVQIIHCDELIDPIVSDRIARFYEQIHEADQEKGVEYAMRLEREIQLLSYDQYIAAISAAPRLAAKLFETEQDKPSERGRLGNPVEDKIAARIIEKKTGYNPSADWKKADKIKEARHKLQMQYDPMTLDLVRAYNPNLHTKDRAGYLE